MPSLRDIDHFVGPELRISVRLALILAIACIALHGMSMLVGEPILPPLWISFFDLVTCLFVGFIAGAVLNYRGRPYLGLLVATPVIGSALWFFFRN